MDTTTARRLFSRRRMIAGTAAVAATGAAMAAGSGAALAAPATQARLADLEEIRQLTVNYAIATDTIAGGDKPGGLAIYQRTFTPDAEIQVAGNPGSLTIGPVAWADFVEAALAAYASLSTWSARSTSRSPTARRAARRHG
jgi:hypothetical protein